MKKHVVVVLDNIRSTFNVGSVLRTSDGAGVDKLYLCGITPTPDHPKIKKTALGAEDYVKWEHNKNIIEVINKLRKDLFKLYFSLIALLRVPMIDFGSVRSESCIKGTF